MEKEMVNIRSVIFLGSGIVISLVTGWFIFPAALYRTEPQPMQFSHKVHTNDQEMACTDCHVLGDDGRFQGIAGVAKCGECHVAQLGESPGEKTLVEEYVTPSREIVWKVYSRQPDNVYFPHASHLQLAQLTCEECHGPHGHTEQLRAYEVNRITGYSRDIWGPAISGVASEPWHGMKMDRCVRCHDKHGRRDGCIDCHK
jgi:hypothetical protein